MAVGEAVEGLVDKVLEEDALVLLVLVEIDDVDVVAEVTNLAPEIPAFDMAAPSVDLR